MSSAASPAAARRAPHVVEEGLATVVRPVHRAQTYRNIAYLVLAFPLGLAWFVFLAVGLSVGLGLAITLIGIPILFGMVFAWRAAGNLERRLAGALLGVRITPPAPLDRERSLATRAWTRLRDPVTWKALVFLVCKFPIGVGCLVAVTVLLGVPLILTLAPVIVLVLPILFFGWEIDSLAEGLLIAPAGLSLGVLALHVLNGIAWLTGLFARLMLGPATVELHDRVDNLNVSRARIIEAGDAERRRIERDLHDGAQQRIVALGLALGLAKAKLDRDPAEARELIDEAHQEANRALAELRELARGIHPAVLTNLGLDAALKDLAGRAPMPVEIVAVPPRRLPTQVEATTYFVVSETLANVAKYSGADAAWVSVTEGRDQLLVEIRDDGVGGADPSRGSGLRGLADRVGALDGDFEVDSPPGAGTTIRARIPLDGEAPEGHR